MRDVTFLWPEVCVLTDSEFRIRATGHEGDGRWTSERVFSSRDSDFEFWRWFYRLRACLPPIIDDREVPGLKDIWRENQDISRYEPWADGIYFNVESAGPLAEDAWAQLTAEFGRQAVIEFRPSHAKDPASKLLQVFCSKGAEVILFKEGRCKYFASLASTAEETSKDISLLAKLICMGEPDEQPLGRSVDQSIREMVRKRELGFDDL